MVDWTQDFIDPRDRRDLRSDAVAHAVWLHGDCEMDDWQRPDKIESVLKTAEAFYNWVIKDE